jgi:hypothetical protein
MLIVLFWFGCYKWFTVAMFGKITMRPSPQRIRELYRYDPDTGLFYWRMDNTKAGGKRYKAGDLAGSPASGNEDADRTNNRWRNLREATRMQNHANRRTFPHSSKYKGVSFDKQTGRWRARIKKDRKLIALGRHDTEEHAHAAYERAARNLFGRFARTT